MPLSNANPRIFIVCDQRDTAPVWGYILREKGLAAILETSIPRALERALSETPDLIVLDVNVPHEERIELCRKFRALSDAPILLFFPAQHEDEILDAYRAGVDECVVKPISPALFLAKIMAWARRGAASSLEERATTLRLDSLHRSAKTDDGQEVRLTNLEFRLLRLLMSRPGAVFSSEEILREVWGMEGGGNPVVLKNVVYRLRKKLDSTFGEKYLIQTFPGGYSFREA
jgi:DNA-binding response OmpR family regulator